MHREGQNNGGWAGARTAAPALLVALGGGARGGLVQRPEVVLVGVVDAPLAPLPLPQLRAPAGRAPRGGRRRLLNTMQATPRHSAIPTLQQ